MKTRAHTETYTDVRRGCTHHSPNASVRPGLQSFVWETRCAGTVLPSKSRSTQHGHSSETPHAGSSCRKSVPDSSLRRSQARGAEVPPGDESQPGVQRGWGPLQAEGPVRGTVTPAGVSINRHEERPKFRVTRFTEHPCAYRKAVFTQSKAANKH